MHSYNRVSRKVLNKKVTLSKNHRGLRVDHYELQKTGFSNRGNSNDANPRTMCLGDLGAASKPGRLEGKE